MAEAEGWGFLPLAPAPSPRPRYVRFPAESIWLYQLRQANDLHYQ